MKKLFAFALALVIVLSLVACGKAATEEAPSPVPAQKTAELSPSEKPVDIVSKEVLTSSIDELSEENGAPALSSLEPTIETMDNGTIAYGYSVYDGVSIYFYEDPASSKLTSVFISLNAASANNDGAYFYGSAVGQTINVLDEADASTIMDKVDISNPDLVTPAVAAGKNANYVYIVNGDLHMFSAAIN